MISVNDRVFGMSASGPRSLRACITDFLDDLAIRIFAVNDSARESEGFQVTAPSRFKRRYRHPAAAIALNAIAMREQRNAGKAQP
ncbi:MAG: hypothetical protein ACRD3Q_17485 [Terriglobales bacterium]